MDGIALLLLLIDLIDAKYPGRSEAIKGGADFINNFLDRREYGSIAGNSTYDTSYENEVVLVFCCVVL